MRVDSKKSLEVDAGFRFVLDLRSLNAIDEGAGVAGWRRSYRDDARVADAAIQDDAVPAVRLHLLSTTGTSWTMAIVAADGWIVDFGVAATVAVVVVAVAAVVAVVVVAAAAGAKGPIGAVAGVAAGVSVRC